MIYHLLTRDYYFCTFISTSLNPTSELKFKNLMLSLHSCLSAAVSRHRIYVPYLTVLENKNYLVKKACNVRRRSRIALVNK